jgi:uncharacterized protein YegL
MGNNVELVFILDRSGSMAGLESDTIKGFNSLLNKQREEAGEAIITTILFDHAFEILHDRMHIKAIANITNKEYYVRGSTALLDAIGMTIDKIVNVQKNTIKEHQSTKVLFVITTDGMENSSRKYNYKTVKRMIEFQKKKYGWEFIFMGANIDAIDVARNFGIDANRAVNYHSDGQGTHLNYQAMNKVVNDFRTKDSIEDDWKNEIDEDFKNRMKD